MSPYINGKTQGVLKYSGEEENVANGIPLTRGVDVRLPPNPRGQSPTPSRVWHRASVGQRKAYLIPPRGAASSRWLPFQESPPETGHPSPNLKFWSLSESPFPLCWEKKPLSLLKVAPKHLSEGFPSLHTIAHERALRLALTTATSYSWIRSTFCPILLPESVLS